MGQISPLVGWNHEPESECKEEALQDEAASRTRTIVDDVRCRMSICLSRESERASERERAGRLVSDSRARSARNDATPPSGHRLLAIAGVRGERYARTIRGNDLSLRHLSFITLVPGSLTVKWE